MLFRSEITDYKDSNEWDNDLNGGTYVEVISRNANANIANGSYWYEKRVNKPEVDAPGKYSGTSNYMGRANGYIIVLPYWKSFYESNANNTSKDIRRDVNFVDYFYKWDKNSEMHYKSYTCDEIAKSLRRYPGKWRREWMALGFVNPNNTGVNYCPLRYADVVLMADEARSEERRVGKECRSRWSPYH